MMRLPHRAIEDLLRPIAGGGGLASKIAPRRDIASRLEVTQDVQAHREILRILPRVAPNFRQT